MFFSLLRDLYMELEIPSLVMQSPLQKVGAEIYWLVWDVIRVILLPFGLIFHSAMLTDEITWCFYIETFLCKHVLSSASLWSICPLKRRVRSSWPDTYGCYTYLTFHPHCKKSLTHSACCYQHLVLMKEIIFEGKMSGPNYVLT